MSSFPRPSTLAQSRTNYTLTQNSWFVCLKRQSRHQSACQVGGSDSWVPPHPIPSLSVSLTDHCINQFGYSCAPHILSISSIDLNDIQSINLSPTHSWVPLHLAPFFQLLSLSQPHLLSLDWSPQHESKHFSHAARSRVTKTNIPQTPQTGWGNRAAVLHRCGTQQRSWLRRQWQRWPRQSLTLAH